MKNRKITKNLINSSLIVSNILILLFIVIYSFFHNGGKGANLFGIFMLITFCCDMIYFVFSKSRTGFFLIFAEISCIALNWTSIKLASSSDNPSLFNFLAVIFLALIPLTAIFLLIKEKKGQIKIVSYTGLFRIFRISAVVLLFGCLIFFAYVAKEAMLTSRSFLDYVFNQVEFLFPLVIFAIICGLFRLLISDTRGKGKTILFNRNFTLICSVLLAGFGVSGILQGVFATKSDTLKTENMFQKMFNTESSEAFEQNMRKTAFCIADVYFGIETKDFNTKKDIVYYTQNPQEAASGLILSYDVYYPEIKNAHRSVIVLLHGATNDKGKNNTPHTPKYFASQGFVVYDIQYGSSGEENTNYYLMEIDKEINFYEKNVDRFFEFAIKNNEFGGNFDSVFIGGISMGGAIAASYSQTFSNSLNKLGINLRGIFSDSSGGIGNIEKWDETGKAILKEDLSYVPCFTICGSKDSVWPIEEKKLIEYKEIYTPGLIYLYITNGRHRCDSQLGGRSNQMYFYYLERFFYKLR